MRKLRVGITHGADQRVDHVVLDIIHQVAHGDRPLEFAPVVLDRFVLRQRVGDMGEDTKICAEDLADRPGRVLPDLALGVGQEVERLRAGQRLAADRETQARDRLVEQAYPGVPSGDSLLVQQALELVVELVGAQGTHVAQPGSIAGQRRFGERGFERSVVDVVQLEGEEDQPCVNRVHTLLNGLIEASDLRIAHVAGVDQLGVAHDPVERFAQPFERGDRVGESLPVEIGELARIARPETLSIGFGAVDVRGKLR